MFPSSVNSQTRAERLCASLSRSFDTPKLATKDSSIHEFIGPMASERYALLPPKSDAAAKALLAVGLKRGVDEVRLLEHIRKRRGLPDLPSPRFDHFVSFMLETPSPTFDRLAKICDSYTPSPLFLDQIPHTPSALEGKQHGTNMAFAANTPDPDSTLDLQHLQLAEDADSAPNAAVVDVDAVQSKPNQFGPASQQTQPYSNAFRGMVSYPKPLLTNYRGSTSKPLEKLTIDLCFDDQTGKVSLDLIFVPVQPVLQHSPQPFARVANPSTHGQFKSVNLLDKLFPSTDAGPSELTLPTDHADMENHRTSLELKGEVCHVRPSAPALNMTTLQDEILVPPVSPPVPASNIKSPPQALQAPQSDSGDDVILIETGPKAAPSPSTAAAAAKSRRKRSSIIARRATPTFQRRKRVKDAVGNVLESDLRPSNKIAPALLRNRQTAARATRESGLRRSKRRARPTAPIVDESDTDNEYRNQEIDEDFEPEVEPIAVQPMPYQEPSSLEAERSSKEEHERSNTGAALQKAKHVRFSDEIEEMQVPEPSRSSPTSRSRSGRPGVMPRKSKSDEFPLRDEEEEILDSHDNVVPRRRTINSARIRKSLPQPSRSKRSHSSSFGGSRNDKGQSSGTKANGPSPPTSFDGDISGDSRNLWKEDILKLEAQLRADDVDSLTSDEDSNTLPYSRMPLLQLLATKLRENRITFEELESINPEEETLRYYRETMNDPPYAPDSDSPGLKWVEDCVKQALGSQPRAIQASKNDATDLQDSGDDDDEDDIDKGTGRKMYRDSSDSSDPLETTDDEEGECRSLRAVVHGGSKRSRREARSRASKARELQGRVCGDLLATMTSEARRRVLRWAERDFTWFDSGCDFMEIVAARSSKRCNRCNMPDDDDLMCEESILLKLWKDMSWRKVRRMRHRHNER